MKNKKKILAAAGILVLAGVAAVCYIQNRDKKEAASIGIIGGADGPTKIFLAGKIVFICLFEQRHFCDRECLVL